MRPRSAMHRMWRSRWPRAPASSVLGTAEEREGSLAGLRSAHGFLQRRVASELRLKHTPALAFHYDPSVDTGMRIVELLEDER